MKRLSLSYPEVSLTEFLRRDLGKQSGKNAIVYPVKIILGDFWAKVDSLATSLAKMGVGKGDRVCLLEWSSPEFQISFNAVVEAGAILVPLSSMSKESEIQFVINDTIAETIIVRDELYPTVKNVLASAPSLKRVIVIGKNLPETLSFEQLTGEQRAKSLSPHIDPRQDLCVIPYTSGTTGLPKGVMLTHYNVVCNVVQCVSAFQVYETDVALNVTPFCHIFGMTVGMLMSMSTGAEQVIMKEFHRRDFCQLIGKFGVTYTFLVPPMFIALVNYPDIVDYDWSSLRFAANGAAPISPDVARKFQDLTGVTVYHQWGLTEASPVVAANPWEKIKIESQGIPLSDTEHKVVDPQTFRELPVGEVGELIVKGPQVMKGYWNRPDETHDAFVILDGEKWLRTGDIARIDDEGYEYIIDRLKETIKYKGFSVSPTEIEKLLFTHPSVADCAVAGKPDSYAGEIPKAFVVPKLEARVTPEDIVDFVKPRIAEYKWVREVEFVSDIPRTPSGKILRKVLIEREHAMIK
jgi:acyl-CoA synthetase (AMP-forming)/AMP-acid ligase II